MAAVSATGQLYTWGEGVGCGHGSDDLDDDGAVLDPKAVQFDAGSKVKTVSCGNYHTAVTTAGSLPPPSI